MTEELKTNLASALVKFQSEVPVIPKNQTAKIPMKSGGSYSYKYADLADIWEAIRKPLKDNGLAVTQFLKSSETTDYIVTKIWFNNGETEAQDFAIPTGGKTPQEVGSVITYYKRYALSAALGISTEEDDDGASGNSKPEPKPEPKKETPAESAKIETDRQTMIQQITAVGVQLGYDIDFIDKKIAGIKNMAEAHQILKNFKEMAKTEPTKEPF